MADYPVDCTLTGWQESDRQKKW